MTLPAFMETLARDAILRDAYVSLLDSLIAQDNSLDRIDAKTSVEYQRGKVAALRRLRLQTLMLDRKGEK